MPVIDWVNLDQTDKNELIKNTLGVITTPFEGSGLPLPTTGFNTDNGIKAFGASVTLQNGSPTKVVTRAITAAHDKIQNNTDAVNAFDARFSIVVGKDKDDDKIDFDFIGTNLITAVAYLKRSEFDIIDGGTF